MRLQRKILSFFIMIALVCPALPSQAQITAGMGQQPYEEIELLKGDIEKIETRNMKRVSITDPAIADISNAKAENLEVVGLAAGQTILFIWDDMGKRTVIIRVIDQDLGFVQKRVESLLGSAGITGVTIKPSASEGKIVLSGRVREDKIPLMKSVIEPFGTQVIDLVEKELAEDLVQIDMQVTLLDSTLDKEFGVKWSGSDGETALSYTEGLPATKIPRQSGSFQDLFKVGSFARTPQIMAQVNALIVKNRAKILSKPRLVVVSGKQATVLVGGEIPVKTTASSASGGSQETITYKEYGLSMGVMPTIREDKMIGVTLEFQDSSPLSTTPAQATQETPLSTTSTKTELILEDHQTIVLAGLIRSSKGETTQRVPFLSAIPIIGSLFRHTSRPDTQKEVVISITATILRSSGNKLAAEAGKEKQVISSSTRAMQDSKAVFEDYAVSVQHRIGSAIAYPYEAQEKGWHGTVKLELVIQKDGALKSAAVKGSSGYAIFDQDAVKTAQILAPYPPFPSELTQEAVTLTVPIVYSLDVFFKNISSSSN